MFCYVARSRGQVKPQLRIQRFESGESAKETRW